jgi:hemoglobin
MEETMIAMPADPPASRATGGRPRSTRVGGAAALFALAGAVSGCTGTAGPSLYERLGGAPVVDAVADATIARAATDPRTHRSFDGIRLPTLQRSLSEQLCALAGGPCRYEGETMARSHHDLKITEAEFDAMVMILREELDLRTGEAEKNALLRLLAPMKRDILAR